MTSSLKQRVFKSASWTVLGFGLSQIIRLGSNLVMTRLLAPEMFGVMAIANMLLVGLALLSDLGIRQSIIQSKHGDDPLFLDTAWIVQIAKAILMSLAALFVSESLLVASQYGVLPANSAYSDPVLPLVVAVISISVVISGFESTKLATANRSLSLGRVTLIELASQVIGVTCMILWGVWHPSIWALVGGSLISALTKTYLSHSAMPGAPNRFSWNREHFREIFSFGKWIVLSSALTFAANNGDRIMLGGILDSKLLGVYAIAFLIISAIQQVFSRIVYFVSFAAFSETARKSPERMADIYYKFRLPLDSIALLASGFLLITGDAIVRLLFDERYAGAGNILEVLSISLIATRYFATDQCLLALGKSFHVSVMTATRAVALYLAIPVAFSYFGYEGAIWAIALSSFASVPLAIYFQHAHNILRVRTELSVLSAYGFGVGAGLAVQALAAGLISHS